LMNSLRRLLEGGKPVVAPLVYDSLSAKLAAAAGFPAAYLGGGAHGYLKWVTEANLTRTEMAQAGLDIRSVSGVPIILDGAWGWGDPTHARRTIRVTEAAGFAATEIEDQLFPKRAHHHVGTEHLILTELMVAKIREAVAARRDPDPMIIARTNAARPEGLEEVLRRAEAYRAACADMLFVLPQEPMQVPAISKRLGGPLMHISAGRRSAFDAAVRRGTVPPGIQPDRGSRDASTPSALEVTRTGRLRQAGCPSREALPYNRDLINQDGCTGIRKRHE
jgi:2-methylisocitrate lyase-like PEP mutase family enzyme